MIDFRELPPSGTRFEQLVRELLLLSGLAPHWTGVGADAGTDILAIETLVGPLGSKERRWLVQCKHTAHAKRARSIGRSDLLRIVDDCREADASAYLLACTTTPSAGVVSKLRKLTDDAGIDCLIWDGVEIEKRLMRPSSFRLAHMFFPESMRHDSWRLYHVEPLMRGYPRPAWAAHYKTHFFYLACRLGHDFPDLLCVESMVQHLGSASLGWRETLRLRGVYFDDKFTHFSAYIDYMIPASAQPACEPGELEAMLRGGFSVPDEFDSWYPAHWEVRLVRADYGSDNYDPNHSSYYQTHDLERFALGEVWGYSLPGQAYAGCWNDEVKPESFVDRLDHLMSHRASLGVDARPPG